MPVGMRQNSAGRRLVAAGGRWSRGCHRRGCNGLRWRDNAFVVVTMLAPECAETQRMTVEWQFLSCWHDMH